MIANLRLTNSFREKGGDFFCPPDCKPTEGMLAYALKVLKELQTEEPRRGWKLECRGTIADWHDYKP